MSIDEKRTQIGILFKKWLRVLKEVKNNEMKKKNERTERRRKNDEF